jgi:sugar phosphate isomerase/epimerase
MKLWYYSHRYTDDDPKVQEANLQRAKERLAELRPTCADRGIRLVAPWFNWAEACINDIVAWRLIESALRWHDGILLDLDGAEISAGMRRERKMMKQLGGEIEVLL